MKEILKNNDELLKMVYDFNIEKKIDLGDGLDDK